MAAKTAPAPGHARTDTRGGSSAPPPTPDRIRAAWSRAAYNLGLSTGPTGLCVIDLDTVKPGDEVPARWREAGATNGEDVLAIVAAEAGQELPGDTLTVRTPSGGLHLYYAVPAGVVLRKTEGERGNGLGWKIDTRAWGGYVIAPGSRTAQGSLRVPVRRRPGDAARLAG